jgi:hypothetical protein
MWQAGFNRTTLQQIDRILLPQCLHVLLPVSAPRHEYHNPSPDDPTPLRLFNEQECRWRTVNPVSHGFAFVVRERLL